LWVLGWGTRKNFEFLLAEKQERSAYVFGVSAVVS